MTVLLVGAVGLVALVVGFSLWNRYDQRRGAVAQDDLDEARAAAKKTAAAEDAERAEHQRNEELR